MNLYEMTHSKEAKHLETYQNSYSDDTIYYIPDSIAKPDEVKELCKKTANYAFINEYRRGCTVEYTYMIGD